jgi:Tol biopolymer transport system component
MAPQDYVISSEEAPVYGFVPEFDEPSTRGQLQRVTASDMFVAWKYCLSPDNRYIVFSGKRIDSREPFQLYKLEIGSTTPIKVTSGGDTDVWDPSFARDGENLVFRTNTVFWMVEEDGTGAKVRIPGSGLNRDYNPQVSADDRIVFVTYDSYSNKYIIWAAGLDGSELTQYREGNFPTWSPDGDKIAFEYDGDIWLMDSDGGNLTQLTSTSNIYEFKPCFSPDGEYIVYVSNESADGGESKDLNIWYMKTNGTFKTQVTELESWDSWPVWSGDWIYFLSGRAKGSHNVQSIWRIKPGI